MEEKGFFNRPTSLLQNTTHYCPGCTHGVAHRLVCEVIDELDIRNEIVGVASVGCSVFIYNYIDIDFVGAPHGRAPAVATGIKRSHPSKMVFCYQGDGDLLSIGTGEFIHAATRGENITVIFINNAIYGMTGGQMAPTSLLGQKTTSSPFGRNSSSQGFPLHAVELLTSIDGVAYAARQSLHSPSHIIKAKKSIRKAFEFQQKGMGFSMVELLSTCPTNWKLDPVDACKWVSDMMVQSFPLGEYKTIAQ